MKRLAAIWLTAALVGAASVPASAYLKLGTRAGARTVTLKWSQMPIRYFLTDRGTTGVTSTQLQQAVARSFSTWAGVPSARVSSEFAGFTLAIPSQGDGATVIGFRTGQLERTWARRRSCRHHDRRYPRGRRFLKHCVFVVRCVAGEATRLISSR